MINSRTLQALKKDAVLGESGVGAVAPVSESGGPHSDSSKMSEIGVAAKPCSLLPQLGCLSKTRQLTSMLTSPFASRPLSHPSSPLLLHPLVVFARVFLPSISQHRTRRSC